jgi:hypothetical protein
MSDKEILTALVGARANEKNHQLSLIKIEHVGVDPAVRDRLPT